jgi:hypothetical protein
MERWSTTRGGHSPRGPSKQVKKIISRYCPYKEANQEGREDSNSHNFRNPFKKLPVVNY